MNKQAEPMYIKTYGCQMNEYDTQKLCKLLADRYYQVASVEEASLILINTCSVREKPEHKLYSLLGKLRQLKDKKPHLLVGVGGCVAQQEGQRIIERNTVVDFVFGTHNLSLVPALIDSRKQGAKPQVAVDYREDWETLPLGFVEDNLYSVFVTISRGCNKHCSYCIVPRTRGPEVSRSTEEILKETRLAVHRGAKEVVLLGQCVNSYGRDFKKQSSFVELLSEISKIEDLKRIRFLSPHPQELTDEFIDLIVNDPKICRHMHLPLQSGSSRILGLMNRKYTKEDYLSLAAKLKDNIVDMAISTDIIVGFPGETDADFEDTLDVLEEVEFDSSYSFVYSKRPGTNAAEMEDTVRADIALARLQRLQARQKEIVAKRLGAWIGREVEVLLDSHTKSDSDCLQGRTSQNHVVNFISKHEGLEPGMFCKAKIVDKSQFTLQGELVGSLKN